MHWPDRSLRSVEAGNCSGWRGECVSRGVNVPESCHWSCTDSTVPCPRSRRLVIIAPTVWALIHELPDNEIVLHACHGFCPFDRIIIQSCIIDCAAIQGIVYCQYCITPASRSRPYMWALLFGWRKDQKYNSCMLLPPYAACIILLPPQNISTHTGLTNADRDRSTVL